MKKRTLALAFACALSLCVLTSCGSKEQPAPAPETPEVGAPVAPEDMPVEQEPETVEPTPGEPVAPEMPFDLSHMDVTLSKEGESFTLTTSQPDAKVYFGSDNEAVATVDDNGVVTAVAPGTATIMAENEAGQTATCTVRCDWKVVVEEQPEQKPEADAPAGTSVDLKAFYESILASAGENAPFMMDVVADLGVEGIEMLYPGLGAIATNQQVLYMPAMSAVACEIAMVECANAADVEAVKAIFQARIDAQVDGGAWYPETIEGWKNNSDIVVNGNYVAMFVIPEGMMDAASEFGKLF